MKNVFVEAVMLFSESTNGSVLSKILFFCCLMCRHSTISKDNILIQIIPRSWKLIYTFCSTILNLPKQKCISIKQIIIKHVCTETNMR